MAQYMVTTPKNPEYDGKAYGVQFQGGSAFVNSHTINKKLGWTLEQVIQKLGEDFNYEIKEIMGESDHLPDGKIAPADAVEKAEAKAKAEEAATLKAEQEALVQKNTVVPAAVIPESETKEEQDAILQASIRRKEKEEAAKKAAASKKG